MENTPHYDQKFENFMASETDDRAVVLHMPDINSSLSDTFVQAIDTSNAPMRTLKKFGNPSRGVHKTFHNFETKDWDDFEKKLNRIKTSLNEKAYGQFFIGCNDYVTAFHHIEMPTDPEEANTYKQGLLKSLHAFSSQGDSAGKRGAGDAINDSGSNGLVVAFPRIEFNDLSECTIHLFSSADPSSLQNDCLHSPDQKDHARYNDTQLDRLGND